jgi:glycerol-1-phosphate dehydrogenase [NAD(P)+]
MVHEIGISLPHKILIKRNASAEIKELLTEMKLGTRCALFCDDTTRGIVGDKLVKDISSAFTVSVINPGSIDVGAIKKIASSIKSFDFCLGVGGGKTIDICKYASFLAGKPWISFPTIPSHDGIVSSRASLEESGKRISIDASEPVAIIADLEVLQNAPYKFVAAGAGDCLSNLSAIEDWKIADRAGKEKYHDVMGGLAAMSAHAIAAHANEIAEKDYHGLEMLMWALISSGFAMNIYGSSRPASGSEHNFSHMLDSLGSKALHGEQVALGTIISLYLQGGDWKRIKNIMKELRLPVTARELGINDEIVIKALVGAKDVRKRYTILDEKKIDTAKAREILRAVGII